MIDLNDTVVWNAIVSLLGGTAIALGERLIVRHTGPWHYQSQTKKHNPLEQEIKIYAQIRQCVDILEEVERGRNIGLEGERIDVRALRQRRIAQEFGRTPDDEIFIRLEQHQLPSIDYIVCYSNTDTLQKGSAEARVITSPLVYTLKRRKKRVKAYAIGTDLIEFEGASLNGIIKIPRQSGYNLNQSLIDLYSNKFQNPTYIFFLMESAPNITDLEYEVAMRRSVSAHNNVVPVFIEIGRPQPPFSIRRLATYLDAIYIQVPDKYNAAASMMIEAFSEAARKMREVVN